MSAVIIPRDRRSQVLLSMHRGRATRLQKQVMRWSVKSLSKPNVDVNGERFCISVEFHNRRKLNVWVNSQDVVASGNQYMPFLSALQEALQREGVSADGIMAAVASLNRIEA